MRDKFIVENYSCDPNRLQVDMNRHFEKCYYPKEIKLEPYQDQVMGFIIYELKE
jgi:hypothetical protein